MSPDSPSSIEPAFDQLRRELAVPTVFPADALAEAARVARDRVPIAGAERADLTAIPFVTIDPPGSRDLDQAVHAERDGDGYRLRYAIADVGFWVDRGGALEREAWRRGVTYYAPDEREPLYPPVLGEGVASLLPDAPRPSVVFDLALDARGELNGWSIGRALVRSRAQLTYAQLLAGARTTGTEPWAPTLRLLGEIGPRRLAIEAARGGVSLPVRDQHVQRRAAAALGYELVYEAPNAAESWNAQVSLLAGHVAARCMLDAGVGLLRTMPTFVAGDVARFRRIARTLGFAWPDGVSYAAFMHGLRADAPRIDVLVRQARRVLRGADYVAFDGAPPEQPLHGALAFTYAHTTAPLRRLGDRYVLDLLVTLSAGRRPTDGEVATLQALAPVLAVAQQRANALDRRVVDVAEAWTLRTRVGELLSATVVDAHRGRVEVQVEEPPVRASITVDGDLPPLGAQVTVRVVDADAMRGHVELALARPVAVGSAGT